MPPELGFGLILTAGFAAGCYFLGDRFVVGSVMLWLYASLLAIPAVFVALLLGYR